MEPTTTEMPTTTFEPTTSTTEEPTTSTTEEPTTSTTEEPTTSTTEEPTTSTTEEPTTTTSTTEEPTTSTTEEPATSTTEEPTTTTTTVAPTTTTSTTEEPTVTTTTPIPDCKETQRIIQETIDNLQTEMDNIEGRILVAQANLNEKNQEFLPILNRVNVYQIVPAEPDHPNFERDFGIANGVIDRRIDKLKTEATDAAGKVSFSNFGGEPRKNTPEYQAAVIADMRYKEYISRKCGNTQELLDARSTYDQTVSNYNTLKALYESQINTARTEKANKKTALDAARARLRDCTENEGTKGACGSDGKDFIADENGKPILFCCNFNGLANLRNKTA
jgi:hypothetical protein